MISDIRSVNQLWLNSFSVFLQNIKLTEFVIQLIFSNRLALKGRQGKGQPSKPIQSKVVTRALSIFKMAAGRHFEYRYAPGGGGGGRGGRIFIQVFCACFPRKVAVTRGSLVFQWSYSAKKIDTPMMRIKVLRKLKLWSKGTEKWTSQDGLNVIVKYNSQNDLL